MSYVEVFKGVVVEASKFCGVGAGISKLEAGAEAESEKGDSAHLCFQEDANGIRSQDFQLFASIEIFMPTIFICLNR